MTHACVVLVCLAPGGFVLSLPTLLSTRYGLEAAVGLLNKCVPGEHGVAVHDDIQKEAFFAQATHFGAKLYNLQHTHW